MTDQLKFSDLTDDAIILYDDDREYFYNHDDRDVVQVPTKKDPVFYFLRPDGSFFRNGILYQVKTILRARQLEICEDSD